MAREHGERDVGSSAHSALSALIRWQLQKPYTRPDLAGAVG